MLNDNVDAGAGNDTTSSGDLADILDVQDLFSS